MFVQICDALRLFHENNPVLKHNDIKVRVARDLKTIPALNTRLIYLTIIVTTATQCPVDPGQYPNSHGLRFRRSCTDHCEEQGGDTW